MHTSTHSSSACVAALACEIQSCFSIGFLGTTRTGASEAGLRLHVVWQVASGGVIRDTKVHKQVIESVSSGIAGLGYSVEGHVESPIKGASKGNTEFLAVFTKL